MFEALFAVTGRPPTSLAATARFAQQRFPVGAFPTRKGQH
jgi:hypothetical protein